MLDLVLCFADPCTDWTTGASSAGVSKAKDGVRSADDKVNRA